MTHKQLRAFMKRHHLSIQDIANMAASSVAAVRAWLRPKTSKAHRNMRPNSEDMIRRALAAGQRARSEGASKKMLETDDPSVDAIAESA